MAKSKKKKGSSLSSINKAVAAAGRFPSTQPSEFKKTLAEFKEQTYERMEFLGLRDDIAVLPKVTRENLDFLEYICTNSSSETSLRYIAMVRDITLAKWLDSRIAYTIQPETFKYMDEVLHIDKMPFILTDLFMECCNPPIYVEFPKGNEIQGVFCGLTRMPNHEVPSSMLNGFGLEEPILVCIVLLENSEPKVYLQLQQCSVYDFFYDPTYVKTKSPDMGPLIKALAYIAFVINKHDSEGSVLIPVSRRDAVCWSVYPIPYADCALDFSNRDYWVVSGLAPVLGYLSRGHMIDAIRSGLDENPKFMDMILGIDDPLSPQYCQYQTQRMVLDWEQCRTVYQYDGETAKALRNKYLEELMLNGFPKHLLKFLPHKTIILHAKDIGITYLTSTCKIQSISGIGILSSAIGNGEVVMQITPATQPGNVDVEMRCSDTADNDLFDSLCALYHILTVFERRTIKRLVKSQIASGNPASTDMVPYATPAKAKVSEEEAEEKPYQHCYSGEIIEDIPVEIFDLTSRTVKRSPEAEKKARAGFKMRPHERRRHPHRYWVGHGEDKHLETRWLEPMRIHAKDKTPHATTILEVR